MPSPQHANDLDPRMYPLAATPTPMALKNIGFAMGGKSVVFREASDTIAELGLIAQEESLLQQKNELIRNVQGSGTVPDIKEEDEADASPGIQSVHVPQERPASPESIAEGDSQTEYTRDVQGPAARTRRSGKQKASQPVAKPRSRLRAVQNSNPVTPETRNDRASRQRPQAVFVTGRAARNVLPSPAIEHRHEMPSRARSSGQTLQDGDELVIEPPSDRRSSRTISRASYDSAVPTPPIEPDDMPLQERRLSARALSSVPARLHVSESPSIQDGTLPSPSLSPVTADASTQYNEYFADVDSNSDFGSQFGQAHGPWSTRGSHYEETPSHGRYESPAITEAARSDDGLSDTEQASGPSVRDIPSVLNFFEALPAGMKSYVMHQLLRRCPKQTLQVVADVVNPVLKCDFLTLLPPELGMHIIRYLDVQSLCRASQVSKKWRQMINSDERAWKERFEADGYSLPEGELQQAIVQGWGWQDPAGPDGREMDMSQAQSVKSDSEIGSPGASCSRKTTASTILRRSKRKAATQLTNRNKMAKRQALSREASVDLA